MEYRAVIAETSDINSFNNVHVALSIWEGSVMLLLDNSPNKVLMIDTKDIGESDDDLPPWSYVPECLSSQLEILEWKKYGGTRDEKQLLAYILANSNCLKRAEISMRCSQEDCNDKKKKKLRKELKVHA